MVHHGDTSPNPDGTPVAAVAGNYELEALHAASNRRRSLGTYYTIQPIADAVASWAITDAGLAVLDPSFGGCSFLRSAVKRLLELGATRPGLRVFGIDIDTAASPYGNALTTLGVPRKNLKYQDFFRVGPAAFPNRFDAIVGNPPYIRHHRLTREILESARRRACAVDIPLDGRSDAWAYFVAHSLSFLRKGARLAFLLPGAALHSDYSKPLLQALSDRFRRLELIQLQERIFDARESTTVLLADGFREGSSSIRVRRVRSTDELVTLLAQHDWSGSASLSGQTANAAFSDAEALRLMENLTASSRVHRLSASAEIRIGVVTGANSFFLRRDEEVKELRSEGVTTVPVVPSSRHLEGATWRKPDQRNLTNGGARTHLLAFPEELHPDSRLIDVIAEAELEGLSERSHCRKRDPWYVLDDFDAPHAFLKYMAGSPSGLVLNHARATCTNSIHRVQFSKGAWSTRYSVVASSWSSLWRLAIEVRGRPYGGGVLKIEPSAAKNLPILRDVPQARGAVEAIDKAARRGDLKTARQRADETVLEQGLGLSRQQVSILSAAADELEKARSTQPS